MSDLLRRTLVFTVLILNKVESTSVELRNVPSKCGLHSIAKDDIYLELDSDYQQVKLIRRNELRLIPTHYLIDRSSFVSFDGPEKCQRALSTHLHRAVDLAENVTESRPKHIPLGTSDQQKARVSFIMSSLERGGDGIYREKESGVIWVLLGILFEEIKKAIPEQGKSINVAVDLKAHTLLYKYNQIVCGHDGACQSTPAEYSLHFREDSDGIYALSDGILSLYPGPGLRLTGVSSLLTVSETAEAHNCCFDQVLARWLHTGTVLGNRGSTLPYSEGESQATVNGIAEGNDAAVDPRLLLEWESSLAALYSRVLKLIQEGSIPGYFLRDGVYCLARFSPIAEHSRFDGHYGLAIKKDGSVETYFSTRNDINFIKPLVKQRWHIPRPSDKAESCRNGLHRVLEYVLKDRKDIAEGISGLTRYQAKLLWMERAWMALSDWEFDPKVYEVRLDSLASKLIAETMEAKERNPSTKKKLQKVTFNDDTMCRFTVSNGFLGHYELGLSGWLDINYIQGPEGIFHKPEGLMTKLETLLVFPRDGIAENARISELCRDVFIAYLIAVSSIAPPGVDLMPSFKSELSEDGSGRRFNTGSPNVVAGMKSLFSIAKVLDILTLADYSEPKNPRHPSPTHEKVFK